jgi:hypothetical protein
MVVDVIENTDDIDEKLFTLNYLEKEQKNYQNR